MNTSVALATGGNVAAYTAAEIKAHIQRIQQVMRSVMKDGVHYGKIPGAGDRKSLFKPGAEVLGTTFRIAPSYRVEDLGTDDSFRYRVTCVGTHQGTGIVLGEGMGSASSSEEKYKWRAAICEKEFDDADEDRKRVKWKKGYNNSAPHTIQQLRTEPDDIDNTVLKMACKRAQVAMIINVLAASDIFSQDLEDLPPEVLDRGDEGGDQGGNGGYGQTGGKAATDRPQSTGGAPGAASEKQVNLVRVRLKGKNVQEADLLAEFKIASLTDLSKAAVNDALAWIEKHGA